MDTVAISENGRFRPRIFCTDRYVNARTGKARFEVAEGEECS